MIERKELDARIAEIQYSRDQSPDDCIYLASLYTIRDHLFPPTQDGPKSYSLASAPVASPISAPSFAVTVSGDSDFLRAVSGKDGEAAWDVIDGLMDTLKAVNPRVYLSFLTCRLPVIVNSFL